MDFKTIQQELVKEWKGYDEEVEVYFHNSTSDSLNEGNFNYIADYNQDSDNPLIGIFTHTGDEYFSRYGKHTYAVVVLKGAKFNGRSLDPQNLYGNKEVHETFLEGTAVQDIVRL